MTKDFSLLRRGSGVAAALLGVALLSHSAADAAPVKVDTAIKSYEKVSGVSGKLSSVGSDTLNNLMTLWGEKFSQFYPSVKIQVEGKGSSTAPPALIGGTAQLGPMSREMKASEIESFEKKFGYKPTAIKTAVDALAVFVHKDNPIKGLTMEQIDAVFSKGRRLGGSADIVTWGQLGLTGEWAEKPISLYGRNSASGTYGYFKEHALGGGDFKDSVKEQPGSASVVQGISVDKFAIGYSGVGYQTAGVKAVPLKGSENATFVEATADNAYSGDYPLARFLYVYVNKEPGHTLDPLTAQFVFLVLSQQGQEVVVKDGYFPLTALVVDEELKKISK